MLALVAKLDGANALLFHVEQSNKAPWHFRVRWPDSSLSILRTWQTERLVDGEAAYFALLDPSSRVEAEWKTDCHRAWRKAKPHEFREAATRFSVTVKAPRDFREDNQVLASAIVRGQPATFCLQMPRRWVARNRAETLTVLARNYHSGLGHILRKPGEFTTSNEVYAIANVEANDQAALLAVRRAECGSNPIKGGVCFVLAGQMTEEELKLLLAHA